MGEYADALRRARLEQDREPTAASRGVAEWALNAVLPEAGSARATWERAATEPEAVVLSDSPAGAWAGRAVLADERGVAAEQFRRLAARVDDELVRREWASVLVAGSRRGEGATTTSCNLALALACQPETARVALVDLDLQRPGIADVLEVAPRRGLEEVLGGRASLSAARLATDLPSLDLYLPGRATPRAADLLEEARLRPLLDTLRSRYTRIVIDGPALPALLHAVDACLAVACIGRTRAQPFAALLDRMPAPKLLGSFANRAPAAALRARRAAADGGRELASPPPLTRRGALEELRSSGRRAGPALLAGGGTGGVGGIAATSGSLEGAALGAVAGLVTGGLLALLRDRKDPVLTEPEELAARSLVVGAVPDIG